MARILPACSLAAVIAAFATLMGCVRLSPMEKQALFHKTNSLQPQARPDLDADAPPEIGKGRTEPMVDRSPERRFDWIQLQEVESFHCERRSVPALLVYPIVGLPRDLLDVPWTALRRAGFADYTGPADEDPASGIVVVGGGIAGAAGAAAARLLLISPPSAAIPIAIGAVLPGGFVGGVAGMNAAMVTGSSGRWLSDAVQVPLLRSGIDSEDYFPNWKYVVHRPVPESYSGRTIWVMVRRGEEETAQTGADTEEVNEDHD